jgi:hypothetical protein
LWFTALGDTRREPFGKWQVLSRGSILGCDWLAPWVGICGATEGCPGGIAAMGPCRSVICAAFITAVSLLVFTLLSPVLAGAASAAVTSGREAASRDIGQMARTVRPHAPRLVKPARAGASPKTVTRPRKLGKKEKGKAKPATRLRVKATLRRPVSAATANQRGRFGSLRRRHPRRSPSARRWARTPVAGSCW